MASVTAFLTFYWAGLVLLPRHNHGLRRPYLYRYPPLTPSNLEPSNGPPTSGGNRPQEVLLRWTRGSRAHLLAGTPSRHDAPDGGRAAATVTKGCATFWVVGEEGEAPRRVAVPVARLGHPRMLELLGEAGEEYGFMRAVEASAGHRPHGHGHGHHHFRLPHVHIARCFRPSHVVA
ncbi:hypothetical protein BS78_04G200600 [Paspalum vaginatum]|nr:hypothetical protein BS78_04G200600 [Paspalum vaginatum]